MYFLWWDKPLDIEEPTVIQGESKLPAVALLCLASEFGYKHEIPERYVAYIRLSLRKIANASPGTAHKGVANKASSKTTLGETVLRVGGTMHGFYIPEHESLIIGYGEYSTRLDTRKENLEFAWTSLLPGARISSNQSLWCNRIQF